MKRKSILPYLTQIAVLTIGASAAWAGNVGVDLNVHIGEPGRVVVPAPQVVVPAPVMVPAPPQVVVEQSIDFVYPDSLGFYVAVGVPYDLFFYDNKYYLFRDGNWHRGNSYRGPWVVVRDRRLPPGLRRHTIDRIRHYRDSEYVVYQRDRDHYRGRHFRADKARKEAWKEERREEKERWKEEKRWDKEERKEQKRWDKEERKQHKGRHDD